MKKYAFVAVLSLTVFSLTAPQPTSADPPWRTCQQLDTDQACPTCVPQQCVCQDGGCTTAVIGCNVVSPPTGIGSVWLDCTTTHCYFSQQCINDLLDPCEVNIWGNWSGTCVTTGDILYHGNTPDCTVKARTRTGLPARCRRRSLPRRVHTREQLRDFRHRAICRPVGNPQQVQRQHCGDRSRARAR